MTTVFDRTAASTALRIAPLLLLSLSLNVSAQLGDRWVQYQPEAKIHLAEGENLSTFD